LTKCLSFKKRNTQALGDATLLDWHLLSQIIEAIIIGIVALVIAWITNRLLLKISSDRIGDKKRAVRNLQRFVELVLFAIAIVLILNVFEVNVTGLIAGLGIGALVIGYALKDIIESWVSGLLIMSSKSYRIGDVIQVGNLKGVVTDISLRNTKLRTYDRNELVIPNALLLKEKIINFTYDKKEAIISLTFTVDYIFNIEKVKKAIEMVLQNHPNVVVNKDKKREIRFVIRTKEWITEIEALFWIDSPGNEEFIKSQITEQVKESFEKEKILPPLPSVIRRDFLKSE
jgi:small-conductance mechanosensitive channel